MERRLRILQKGCCVVAMNKLIFFSLSIFEEALQKGQKVVLSKQYSLASICHFPTAGFTYSKTCVKWPIKSRQNKDLDKR